jgi:tubulin polyglutamylase TTLL4
VSINILKSLLRIPRRRKMGKGSKWSITALKKFYDENGIDTKQLFNNIKDVIIKTCISAEPVMLDIHSKTQ